MKIETRRGEGDSRRSYIWTVNPARSQELEQSLAKLMERDKENTLKCLANPGKCNVLFVDAVLQLNFYIYCTFVHFDLIQIVFAVS